jgi:hypothetical protein
MQEQKEERFKIKKENGQKCAQNGIRLTRGL